MSKRTLDIDNLIQKALIQTPFKPKIVRLKNHTFPYMRIEIPIPTIDPLAWLKTQTIYPKIYFETPKTGLKIAGIGNAYSLNELPSFQQYSASPRFFGGMDFYERKAQTWDKFPTCRYTLPLIEMEVRNEGTFLCINRTSETLNLRSIHFNPTPISLMKQTPISRLDAPSFPIWQRNIRDSLKLINKKLLDKIVLARVSLFEFEQPLLPLDFCKALQGKSSSATLFFYQFSSTQAFFGATPEHLYKRNGKKIETAAIAGTRPRGNNKKEDQALQKDLLKNTKELHEFHVVKEEIEKQLSPLCSSFTKKNNNRIIQTSKVQHICQNFEGLLHDGINDACLIQALHPTPAVGGRPKEAAMQKIRTFETFDRGWFAAPIGWISLDQAHLLVGIRSALIQENQLRLFTGTGIVPGSLPQKEWEELEYKISQFILW